MTDNGMREITRCSKSYRFLFYWSLEKRKIPPSDAFVRVYMRSSDSYFFESNTVAVRVSVKLHTIESSTTDETWTFLRIINVDKNSSTWLEFNIKELIVQFWDLVNEQAIISVTLRFDVNNCKQKVPMNLLKRLNKATRLETSPFRPILLISTDDIEIKRAIMKSYHTLSLDQLIIPEDYPTRRKRDAPDHICQIENFTVTFSELGIRHIILPLAINIRRCMGGCSINYAPDIESLSNTHARLMTSATSVYENSVLSPNSSPPENPCCSPISYHPAYLLKGSPRSCEVACEFELESDIIARECGCR